MLTPQPRRPLRLAALVAMLALALPLVACGSDDEADGSANAETTAAASQDAFPVTIEHKYGTTEIASAPQRVATVGYTEQDIVLALGVTPVGVREFLGGYDWRNRPWAQELLGGEEIETIGGEEINFERVAAVRPDLIVGVNSGMSESDYRTLSKIAPTVPQSGEHIDFGVPWQEQTTVIGRALGKAQEGEQLVAEVEARFAELREEHPDWEQATAALGYADGGTFGAYASQDYRTRFFADLGLRTPERIDELSGEGFYTEFSQEQIRLLDQDLLIMFASEDDAMRSPVYRRLDAVREGRVIYLDLTDQLAGALGFGSPLSLRYAAENFAPKLDQALDGDPATEVEQPE